MLLPCIDVIHTFIKILYKMLVFMQHLMLERRKRETCSKLFSLFLYFQNESSPSQQKNKTKNEQKNKIKMTYLNVIHTTIIMHVYIRYINGIIVTHLIFQFLKQYNILS